MRPPRVAFVASLLLVALSIGPASVEGSGTQSTQSSADPVIAAVGDQVCNRGPKEGPERAPEYGKCRYMKVSDIVANGDYDAFFALGDEQYLKGSLDHFTRYYDPSYGRVKDITYPVPGNHEYYTAGAAGYYRYFGKRAHGPWGYYSFDIGEWHVIALNSQLCKNKTWYPRTGYVHGLDHGRCHQNSPEYKWLQRDLQQNSDSMCTLAMMHHPLYKWSYWQIRKEHRIQRPLVRLLYLNHAEVVLAGHWHNYQRFAPMDATGHTDPNGVAEFIVGTGGDTYSPLPKKMPKPTGLEAVNDGSYGVLQMTLHPDSYDWKFVTAEGEPAYEDSGTAQCR